MSFFLNYILFTMCLCAAHGSQRTSCGKVFLFATWVPCLTLRLQVPLLTEPFLDPLKTPLVLMACGQHVFQHLHHICVFWVFRARFSVGSWYVLTLMSFRLLFTVVWPSTNLPVWIGEGCRRLYCNIFWFSRIINIPSWISKKWWEWEKWVGLSDFFYNVFVCVFMMCVHVFRIRKTIKILPCPPCCPNSVTYLCPECKLPTCCCLSPENVIVVSEVRVWAQCIAPVLYRVLGS